MYWENNFSVIIKWEGEGIFWGDCIESIEMVEKVVFFYEKRL